MLSQARVRLRRIPLPTLLLRLSKLPNLQRTELPVAWRKMRPSLRNLQRRLPRLPPVQKSSLRLLLRIRSRHQRQLPAHQGIHPQLHRKKHHRPRRSKMPQRSPMHLKREAPRRQRQVRWMPTRHSSRSRCFLPWRLKGKRLRQQRSPRPTCKPSRNWLPVRYNNAPKSRLRAAFWCVCKEIGACSLAGSAECWWLHWQYAQALLMAKQPQGGACPTIKKRPARGVSH